MRAASRAVAASIARIDDLARVGGIFLEVLAELLVDQRRDHPLDFGVAELGLGLALELRLGQLDADDRDQALAGVVALEAHLLVL